MPKHAARHIKGEKGMENTEREEESWNKCVSKCYLEQGLFKTGIAQACSPLGNWLIIDGF